MHETMSLESNSDVNLENVFLSKIAKANKKNIVKNFFKAFKNFLLSPSKAEQILKLLGLIQESGGEEGNAMQALDEFKRELGNFEKKRKYNNKLIKDIIQNEQYRMLFIYFLQHEAQDWLENSQVIDKRGHKAMICYYLKACDKPDILEQFNKN